jgi:hypothetical protein
VSTDQAAVGEYTYTCRIAAGGPPPHVVARALDRIPPAITWGAPRATGDGGYRLVGRGVTMRARHSEAVFDALVAVGYFASEAVLTLPVPHEDRDCGFSAVIDRTSLGVPGVNGLELAVRVRAPADPDEHDAGSLREGVPPAVGRYAISVDPRGVAPLTRLAALVDRAGLPVVWAAPAGGEGPDGEAVRPYFDEPDVFFHALLVGARLGRHAVLTAPDIRDGQWWMTLTFTGATLGVDGIDRLSVTVSTPTS